MFLIRIILLSRNVSSHIHLFSFELMLWIYSIILIATLSLSNSNFFSLTNYLRLCIYIYVYVYFFSQFQMWNLFKLISDYFSWKYLLYNIFRAFVLVFVVQSCPHTTPAVKKKAFHYVWECCLTA